MISVQRADFDLQQEYEALRAGSANAGAIVTFSGLVREFYPGDDSQCLLLEHYPGMTEKSLQTICAEATGKWDIQQLKVIHRIGELHPGEQIVFVGVSSRHRGDAFKACEFIMDFLKTRAPFWKKEIHRGGSHWVEARQSDNEAAARWQK